MAEFALDTSGMVRRPGFAKPLRWSDLSPFEHGYVEALFASLPRDDAGYAFLPHPNGLSLVAGLAYRDLSPEALALILRDCEAYRGRTSSNIPKMGALFWKNRAAGYESGDGFGILTPCLSDDGKVCLRADSPR